jgi:hypothetical protein
MLLEFVTTWEEISKISAKQIERLAPLPNRRKF